MDHLKNPKSLLYTAFPSTALHWVSINKAMQACKEEEKYLVLMPTYYRSCIAELATLRERKMNKFYGSYNDNEELQKIEEALVHAIHSLDVSMKKLNITPNTTLTVSGDHETVCETEFSNCEILRQQVLTRQK